MPPAPIILVPGFWLGAWAWDEVAAALRSAGHEVTSLTLPGLDWVAADRTLDHVRRPRPGVQSDVVKCEGDARRARRP